MAWKNSARIKAPKHTEHDLWVGFKPYGMGETKPNHYASMAKVVWRNHHHLRTAWKILRKGVCDGCALGVAGFHDWTLDGVHLCTTRLELLELNTADALDPKLLADVARLRELDGRQLRELGGLPSPMIRRKGEPGFQRISWDEALSIAADRIRAVAPDRLNVLPHRPRHHERGVLHRAEGRPLPRHQQRRQRGTRLPRAVDHRTEANHRHRRDHLLVHRRDQLRSHRAVRRERRRRATGVHEVPLPRPEAGCEGRRRQPAARAGARALLGAEQRRARDVRHQDGRRLLPRPRRGRRRVHQRRHEGHALRRHRSTGSSSASTQPASTKVLHGARGRRRSTRW